MSKKSKPFLAHSELTDCIYIIDGNDKYEVTEQCIKAMKATNRMPRWIPVSERLPKTTDYYLVTVGINEYGLMIPSVRTALYNAETKDFTIHTGTNMCIVGDVVAWRDCLPEPYKAESEE